ncbi:VOC family protein [Hymenobacter sp. BRD67]|uniref:VOC family protein n=1 Tax=Hymenobacter sp. BRD67 TaxID=2675877 RepID=UPI0020B689CA|nr:VOC family protein [Hymenobacter sp. BRD67]
MPAGTSIGHIHLQVTDMARALRFYHDLLGFEVMLEAGEQAAFLSADGYHHHIGLNTWHSQGASRPCARAWRACITPLFCTATGPAWQPW